MAPVLNDVDDVLLGLGAALACPAIFPGEKTELSAAVRSYVTSKIYPSERVFRLALEVTGRGKADCARLRHDGTCSWLAGERRTAVRETKCPFVDGEYERCPGFSDDERDGREDGIQTQMG